MMTSNGFIDFTINTDKINQRITSQPVEASAPTSDMYEYEGNLDGDYWIDDADTLKSKFKPSAIVKLKCKSINIWIIICITVMILLGSIYAIAVLISYQHCYHLTENFDSIKPETISYDPNIYNNFKIEDFNNVQEGEIIVSQSDVPNVNATLSVRLSTIKNFDSFTKSEFQDSTFNLQILRKSFPNSSGWAWLGDLSIPPKCIAARLELTLPNLNFTTSRINSKKFNLRFKPNPNPYSNPILLETTKGDVTFENISLTNQLLIQTNDGNILGELFQTTNNDLSIKTDDGYVKLDVNILDDNNNNNNNNLLNKEQSKIRVTTSNGNIGLGIDIEKGIKSPNVNISSTSSHISVGFNNSFNGQYDIKTSTGDINIEKNSVMTSQTDGVHGSVGDFNDETLIGSINIQTNSGDIYVKF